MRFYCGKGVLILILFFPLLKTQEIEEEEINEPILIEEIFEKKFLKINVNKADIESLLNVPGINKALAEKILKERKKTPFLSFEEFKERLKLNEDYEYLKEYFDFGLSISNIYSEIRGNYYDKYGENKYSKNLKGKLKGYYSSIEYGLVHKDFREFEKFYLKTNIKGLKIIAGNYIYEFGKGFLFGKKYSFSGELFYIPSNLKKIRESISYSKNIGEKGIFINYKDLDILLDYKKDSSYTAFITFPLKKFQAVSLFGITRDLINNKTYPLFSFVFSIYKSFYLYTETGYSGKSLYSYIGIRKIYDFSRLFLFFYFLPENHFNLFNIRFDSRKEGKDEKGFGIRWESKWKKFIIRIDERLFESSDFYGGYESFLRILFKLNRNFNYLFEIKDRKTSIHRVRIKNEMNFSKKEFEITLKNYFEWKSYFKESPGMLGGIEIKKNIFLFGIYSFNINDYDKRIYIFEPEPPTSFYLKALYGTGSRVYVGIKLKMKMGNLFLKYSENISNRIKPEKRLILILNIRTY